MFWPSSSSHASTSSSPASSPPGSPALSFASTSTTSTFDLLEPVAQNELPHLFVVERSLAAPFHDSHDSHKSAHPHSHRSHHHHSSGKRAPCTLDDPFEGEKQTIFSFPRNHTHHRVCPRHGIVHDPALALPERDSRTASSKASSTSRSSAESCSSRGSGRSLKCALRRLKNGDHF
ncbi:hypothetical protein JCM6882_009208 [Rhodosporidiobolus microsporus]